MLVFETSTLWYVSPIGVVVGLSKRLADLTTLCQLRAGTSWARSHDITQIRVLVGKALKVWMMKANEKVMKSNLSATENSDENNGPAYQAPLPYSAIDLNIKDNDRSGRGLKHALCGFLLCPIELNWNDPMYVVRSINFSLLTSRLHFRVRANIRAFLAEFDYACTAHARCFFPKGRYDVKMLDKYYLRSTLLLQVRTFGFSLAYNSN